MASWCSSGPPPGRYGEPSSIERAAEGLGEGFELCGCPRLWACDPEYRLERIEAGRRRGERKRSVRAS